MSGTAGADDGAQALDDVFSSSRDRGADSAAPEHVEEAPAPEVKAEAVEPKAETEVADAEIDAQPQGRDPKTGRFVPVSELISERNKYRSKVDEEARLRMQAEERAKFYESQFQAVQRQQQQPPPRQEAPRPIELPDPFTDPQGYAAAVHAQALEKAQSIALNEKCNTSEMLAREKHGDDLVNQALDAATRAGIAPRFVQAPNPYGDMVRWFKQAQALQRIGHDPDAYEKSIRDKLREEILAELKAGKLTTTGRPAAPQPQRFPGTLADATASGAQGAVLTDEAMMADVFGSGRRSRMRA